MKPLNSVLSILFFLPSFVMTSQTVNTGELVVTEGTTFSTLKNFNNTSTGAFINDGNMYAYSHFNNDGTVDFIGNSGLTRFIGSLPQSLSGSKTSYLYNVLFDNASVQPAFELSGDLSVANVSEFNLGIVDVDTYGGTLTFEQNGNHISTGTDSHVDGAVIKIGDNAFTYPTGDSGYYRYAEISSPNDPGDTFTGKYFFENPENKGYTLANRSQVIAQINNQEYWTLTKDTGTSNVLLALSWDETTTPQEMVANPNTLHIVRWDEINKMWADEGGVVDTSKKTVTTRIELDQYGIFTLARIKEDALLPGNVLVYNGLSMNGDGKNDYFFIDNIQKLANNTVEIYNRWGVKIFETSNYDTSDNVFRGHSEGRMTLGIRNKKMVPTGTYFYVLNYDYTTNENTQRVKQMGYLYVTAN